MAALLGNAAVLDALKRTDDPRHLPELWRPSLAEFQKIRAKYVIYSE